MKIQLQVFNEKLYEIIDPNPELEAVVTGFEFTEGPIWSASGQHLTFSDIPGNKIYRWSEDQGLQVLVESSNKANGNCYDLEGRILTCEHATSLVSRMNADGTNREVLVSHYKSRELNSPNDIVVKSDGIIYFTDPRFGRNPSRVGVPREQELSFQGVFCYKPQTGELILLSDDFENPNGLCFSVDEKQLFVNDSPRSHIRVFDVNSDGTLSNSLVWAVTEGEGLGLPDGMKIDLDGNIYCCAQGGIHIFDKHATYLGIVFIPEQAANFNWGGDLHDLFITASTTIYRVKVKTIGASSRRF